MDNIQEQITQAKLDDTTPLSHGWKFAYFHEDFDGQPVFIQGDAKLMRYEDDWMVQFLTYRARYQGTIEEVTKDVLKELSK